MTGEICFEAPEINMASDIVLDARVSIVTVSKLVDVSVTGNCVCPSGSSGNFESIEKSRNVSTVFERAPARAAPRSVTSSDDAAPKAMTSFSGNREPPLKVNEPTTTSLENDENVSVSTEATENQTIPSIQDESSKDDIKSTSEKDDDSIEQPLSSSLRPPSSVAKPSVTESEFTDATITADEFSEEVLKYPRNIGVDGALTSEWKNQNILGDFELMKEDSVGRPIYKRKEPTSQGKQVYLYHIHQTKKWRIGPAHEGAEAHNCWLFITSKVPEPLLIQKDQERTKRTWHEHSSGKWIPVKDLKITLQE